MADGDTEDLLYTPEEGPVLESHDPSTGMGTFRMPDQTTMDVHLPSAGITPHPTIPVVPSAPASRVPVRDDLADITAAPLATAPRIGVPPSLRRPVEPQAPESIAITPQQARADRLRQEGQAQRRAYDLQQFTQEEDRQLQELEHARTAEELARQQRMAQDTAEQEARITETRRAETADQRAARIAREGAQAAGSRAQSEADIQAERQRYPIRSAPDEFGIVTETLDPAGHTSRTGPQEAFDRERRYLESFRLRHTPTSEGVTIGPDGRRIFPDGMVAEELPVRGDTGTSAVFPGGERTPDTSAEALARTFRGEEPQGQVIIGRDRFGRPHYGPAPTSTDLQETFRPGDRVASTDRYGTPSREVVTHDQFGNPIPAYVASAEGTTPGVHQTVTLPDGTQVDHDQEGNPIAVREPTSPAVAMGSAPQTRTPRISPRPSGRAGAPSMETGLQQTEVERQLGLAPQAPPQYPPTSARLPTAIGAGDVERLAGQAPQREPDLIERQYNVEAKRARIASDAAQMQMDIERQAEQQRQQTERERQQAVGNAQRRYQNAIDTVANSRIDPTHFWHEAGAAGMVGATIAVALGALGNAFTGGTTNGALEIINRAVDRDISAQEQNLSNLRDAAGMQGNMVGIMRQEFSDRDAANQAAHAAMLTQAALQVQQHEADLSDASAQNAATQLRQQLEAAAEEARQQAIVTQSEVDLRTAQAQQYLARGEESLSQAALLEQRRQRIEWMRAHPGQRAPEPATTAQFEAFQHAVESTSGSEADRIAAAHAIFDPGSYYYEHPPAHAPVTGTERAALEEVSSALDQVEELIPPDEETDIPGYGASGMLHDRLVTQEGRDLRRAMANLTDAFGRMRTGANMPAYEVQTFERILGTAPYSSDADLRNGLQLMRAIVGRQIERMASSSTSVERDVESTAPGARRITE